jgi:hypothetical protein
VICFVAAVRLQANLGEQAYIALSRGAGYRK